ncbi:hypothetical protein [Pseudoalteromonas ruthenica]|uniref:hypothetical protein n=1 Tax=Pseudoalteromonas ruthenica TaxID=151081 RepID=UPI0003B3B253|nr:hypothetical protein [Pseudoalteromonas ruthenica]
MEASVAFIGKVVVVLVGIASIIGVVSRVYLSHSSQNYKRVELYQQLQKLCGTDANTNLSEILVILRLFTPAHLTNKEIEWFIWTPGAFRYLPEYGRKIDFIEIDYENASFQWRGSFSQRRKLLRTLAWFLAIYGVVGTVGATALIYALQNLAPAKPLFAMAVSVAGLLLLMLSAYFLREFLNLMPPQYLIERKLRGDAADK